jgi:hypothetical protein
MVFPLREDRFPRWIALFPRLGTLAPARETSRPGSDTMRPEMKTVPITAPPAISALGRVAADQTFQ